MAENTEISWADDTFNPWMGCTKVSPACDGCYAEALMDTRYGKVTWGPHGDRVRTAPANWNKPLKWDREQQAFEHNSRLVGETAPPRFVFCASLADVFDNQVPVEWRRDLFDLIHATPHLTWLLLTKRPQNIERLWFKSHGSTPWPRNAAIGCTVVTQAEADRDIPALLLAAAALEPAFAFVSMEPLLGQVNLREIRRPAQHPRLPETFDALTIVGRRKALGWVITGGETDQGQHKARPSHTDWFRSLRDQCAAAGVPYHHKQNGEWIHRPEMIDAGGSSVHRFDDGAWMDKVGKKAAGRLLDGVTHDARPTVRS